MDSKRERRKDRKIRKKREDRKSVGLMIDRNLPLCHTYDRAIRFHGISAMIVLLQAAVQTEMCRGR